MKLFSQIAIIFGICLLGNMTAAVLPFPVPSSVVSMLLLLALLCCRALKPASIEDFSGFLLGNMAFFFIPASVELMDYFDFISQNLIAFVTICVVSTVVTFGVTGYTVRLVMAMQRKLAGGEPVE